MLRNSTIDLLSKMIHVDQTLWLYLVILYMLFKTDEFVGNRKAYFLETKKNTLLTRTGLPQEFWLGPKRQISSKCYISGLEMMLDP